METHEWKDARRSARISLIRYADKQWNTKLARSITDLEFARRVRSLASAAGMK